MSPGISADNMRRRLISGPLPTKTEAKTCDFRRKNRKEKYRDATTGLHPFVKLVEAGGAVFPEAELFLKEVARGIENQHRDEHERRTTRRSFHSPQIPPMKTIDAFRADPRYGGDGTRIDLAYAVYAIAHGQTETEVETAIRSRDLSHKGSERRQQDYVERTIKKALAATDRSR
jgi:hypothetical protein